MLERRQYPRSQTAVIERLLTLHGARGHVCGRAEDESDRGLGIRVRQLGGLQPGQVVLVHRIHEEQLHMGMVRYIGHEDSDGYRLGIELFPESDRARENQ